LGWRVLAILEGENLSGDRRTQSEGQTHQGRDSAFVLGPHERRPASFDPGATARGLDHRNPNWKQIDSCVAAFVRVYALDSDETDDLRQECLCKILLTLHTFKGHSSLSTWIYRLVRNEFISSRRKARAYRERLTEIEGPSPDLPLDEQVLARAVADRMLKQVEPLDREILSFRYLREHTSREVGEHLGQAPSTVRVRTMACRRRLRRLFPWTHKKYSPIDGEERSVA